VIDRALCPVLVRRDEELSILEDALLSAHRGESRFVVLAGEAGVGKTRLTTELARQARKLGCTVLWGSCSEAELSLPYLPFVEAIGNYLATQNIDSLARRLGPTRSELAQLFPQFSDGESPTQGSDPQQAKLRLFEAIVSLLVTIEHTAILILEDVHWADDSTRELVDHLSRRLESVSVFLLVTYRDDELHRGHALQPLVQSWRRSRTTEMITLHPLSHGGVAEMVAAIFDEEEIGSEFADLMHERTEGNPFVLEEMLKESIDRGDIFRTDEGWDRKSLDELGLPDTVRDAILLRLGRLSSEVVAVLQAAAVLGRTFEYALLLAVSDDEESFVQRALESAIRQQLIEEHTDAVGTYRWRHALTQEAIFTDTVTPRRQQIHRRAADEIIRSGGARSIELAHHLLGAARFAEAVPICLRCAEEAEHAAAFREAVSVLERALPHVTDETERAGIVCRIGRNYWLNGDSGTAEQYLAEGIEAFERVGERLEAARFRVILGRCRWERLRPDLALADFEGARDVLELAGPSSELAVTYMRIAGLRVFELDHQGGLDASRKAVETAEAAGADFERVWANSFLALAITEGGDVERGLEVMDRCIEEAMAKRYWLITSNAIYNDIWLRVHLLQGDLEARLEQLAALPPVQSNSAVLALAASYVKKARGDLLEAREQAELGVRLFADSGVEKMVWRCRLQLAEVLLELGRLEEAEDMLPPVSNRTELQDITYDAPARIRVHLVRGLTDEAEVLAREILARAEQLALYKETLAVGAEAFVAAGNVEEALALIAHGRANSSDAGAAFLDGAQGRVLLARAEPEEARSRLQAATDSFATAGYRIAELRARVLLAEATARTGDVGAAAHEFRRVVEATGRNLARLIGDEARAKAEAFGLSLPAPVQDPGELALETRSVMLGERLVTSMFADVRGSTALTASSSPQEHAERMDALYRFARTEVDRHHGIVDKFAGDAVMATFNVSGARVDHCVHALEAAFTLRDKAALTDLQLGIGIAVGPAVLGRGVSDGNIAVRGEATNLAARLQAAAGEGEILLSEEAHRRVRSWLGGREIHAHREELDLKGFDSPQVAFRIPQPSPT
jgi:class 3 adenylate cyclase